MVQYDKIFSSKDITEEILNEDESVAAIAIIAAMIDTESPNVDRQLLAKMLWEFEVFEDYSHQQILAMVNELISIAQQQGLAALFNAADEALPDYLVPDGFAAGVIALVDQEKLAVPQEKIPFLQQLQQALDINDQEAQEIITDVIAAVQETANTDSQDLDSDRELYESPLGNFQVPIPVNSQEGGRVDADEGFVTFSDDFGTLLRIDYYPVPPEEAEKLQTVGEEEYCKSILLDRYVPGAIIPNLPASKVIYSEYLPDYMSGAYFVVVDMPQGSNISKQTNNEPPIRLDAYRGIIAFIYDNFLYLISNQHSFFVDEVPEDTTQEIEDLQTWILDFVDTIEFE
ncbi:MAG: tellurite resistance TerB family protein [Nostocaceae cyanobacterium]|nr:tellurite resistance TerB family protein [Nostocaceae cyanobacterium]